MGGSPHPDTTSITIRPLSYQQMKWYIPLIIVASFLFLLAIFGEPGTPSLIYETETRLTETDPANLTVTYTVTLTVTNTGTAAADNTIVAVYLTTPSNAPEWQQAEIVFPIGRIDTKDERIVTETTTLTTGEETYSLLLNGTSPETTIVGKYSDAFF